MSISVIPAHHQPESAPSIAALRLPAADLPYGRRAARLRQLAQGHPMADYLLWSACLVDAQQATAWALALPQQDGQALARVLCAPTHQPETAPLHSAHWARSEHWQLLLEGLLNSLKPSADEHGRLVRQAIDEVLLASPCTREQWANALLALLRGDVLPGNSQLPQSSHALFVWSALSMYWRQLASQLPAVGVAQPGSLRALCPVCGHAPTGSLILDDPHAGLRYLQCSLCESQWHVVRSHCTQCDGSGELDYWCLDDKKAAVKAESCGECHSYLKAFYRQADAQIELVADDLASLALDAELDAQALSRTGLNPLMLPALV